MDTATWMIFLIVITILLVINAAVGIWNGYINSKYVDLSTKLLLAEKENRDWMSGFMIEQSEVEKRTATNHRLIGEIYKLIRDTTNSDLPPEELSRRLTERLKRMSPFFEDNKPPVKSSMKGGGHDITV